jgi:hypothetical protein
MLGDVSERAATISCEMAGRGGLNNVLSLGSDGKPNVAIHKGNAVKMSTSQGNGTMFEPLQKVFLR